MATHVNETAGRATPRSEYSGGDLSLAILLPEAADGLTALERQLSAEHELHFAPAATVG